MDNNHHPGMASWEARGLTTELVLRWGHARRAALGQLSRPVPRFVAELEAEYQRRRYLYRMIPADPAALWPCTCPPVLPDLESTLPYSHGYGYAPGLGWAHE